MLENILVILMDDNSIMPFGKYKGRALIDVPASWLLWFNDVAEPNSTEKERLLKYIADNIIHIRQEAKNEQSSS